MPVSPDDGANLVRCRTRILVLPDPDRRPSSSSQHAIYLGVPLSGSLQLQEPVVSVCPRSDRVLGTPVPEAAVDENGDADTAEYEISRSAQGRERSPLACTSRRTASSGLVSRLRLANMVALAVFDEAQDVPVAPKLRFSPR